MKSEALTIFSLPSFTKIAVDEFVICLMKNKISKSCSDDEFYSYMDKHLSVLVSSADISVNRLSS